MLLKKGYKAVNRSGIKSKNMLLLLSLTFIDFDYRGGAW